MSSLVARACAYPRHVGRWIRWKGGFCRRLRTHDPIFVFQMGKVASHSIYAPLVRVYRGAVVHGHGLSADYGQGEVEELHRYLNSPRPPRRMHVISLVREPIGRNVSAFFENFEDNTGVTAGQSTFSMAGLRGLFLRNFPHDQPLTWLDQNILEHFGIDVYATPFPAEGHATYEKGPVRLLLMRVEIADSLKETCVRRFLDMPGFVLTNANVGEAKEYRELYRRFRQEVRLPAEYVDRFCASRYFRHFYPAEVIEDVRRRWTET